MDEQVVDAPTEEAQPEEQEEVQPEVQPAEEKSPLLSVLDNHQARLVALEQVAHSGHNLDASAIDQIVALVLERINADVKKLLG